MRRPGREISQGGALEWIRAAHVASEAARGGQSEAALRTFSVRMGRLIERCACGPDAISARGHVVPDVGSTNWDEHVIYDLARSPTGKSTSERMAFYRDAVFDYFREEYRDEPSPPGDVVHVTCTGYVSPSAAQCVAAERGWGARTRVTHAYHMGCYAALPAVRIGIGALAAAPAIRARDARHVDIVHTELCSLHFDPSRHSAEQVVVQSLFADGFIRYSLGNEPNGSALRVLAMDERIVPNSAGSMTWVLGDSGMSMTLSRRVCDELGAELRRLVLDLFARADLDASSELPGTVFAVHPGGPRIIDAVSERLELRPRQVEASRAVLRAYGNMSSATLPHVWMRIVEDDGVAPGTLVLSLAFGPGLTICGALFRKE